MNFLEYVGKEEQNFLISMTNLREEFDLFKMLDDVYQSYIKRYEFKANEEVIIASLYQFVHFYLYFSISCIMRTHLSEALSSLRKAIDSSLIAYEIILNPDLAEAYLDKKHKDYKKFKYMKTTMEKSVKNDNSRYPLAHELIKLHSACSQYGSHADFDAFVYRLDLEKTPEKKIQLLNLQYFQFSNDKNTYKMYFISILLSFWHILKIFKSFFEVRLKIIDPNLELTFEKLGIHLPKLRKKYYEATKLSTDK